MAEKYNKTYIINIDGNWSFKLKEWQKEGSMLIFPPSSGRLDDVITENTIIEIINNDNKTIQKCRTLKNEFIRGKLLNNKWGKWYQIVGIDNIPDIIDEQPINS